MPVRRTLFIKVAARISGHCSDGIVHCKNGHRPNAARYDPLAAQPVPATAAPVVAIARIEPIAAT
jgi:hypothetical protein